MNAPSAGDAHSDMSLEDREEQLRLAVEAAEVGLWDVDVVTGTLYWPARVKAMFGISAHAAATLDDFVAGVHPDDRPAVVQAFAEAQDPGLRAIYDVEYRTVGKEDGRVRWVAAKGRGLFDEAGVCRRAIGTAIDITLRKEAEALQRIAQQRLHVLDSIERATRMLTDPGEVMQVTTRLLGQNLGATRCAYADVEPDNNRFTIRSDWSRPGVPSSAGAYTLDLFGPQATSNLRNGRHLVVHDVDAELGDEGGGRMFNAIGIKAIVCAGLVKAGRLVAMMAVHQAHPRRWTEDDLRIITDVVDRCWVHIERVRDAAALRDQDRRKDEFLATLAHELRNPIAPMLFSLALLQRTQAAEDQARSRAVIERQARHLVRLIDDLLDVSRINRGLVELKREVVALGPLVAQALEAVTPAMERARHRLSVQIADAPAWIDADPARVVQAVTNLLTNAAKYTPDQGEIRLSVSLADDKAHIALADNGLGIDPADHDRVFEMFTQLPHTGKKAHGGLGIGLSLVKRLVDMHGGAVGVRSAGLHQGSTFWIELPLTAAPQAAAAAEGARGNAQPKGRVLVVEDNVDGLAALVELIETEGHAVRGAPDGPSALQTAAQWRPDIVLLDLGLPQMDGYEVAARMRQDLGLAQARIVALTGWGTRRDREKTAAAGFDAHLTKPVAPDDLLELLGRWLTPEPSAASALRHDGPA
ncbi:hybrid sensor histidine kinase/response regulator [Pseudorhodoferax soli]|uniref:histidine kinase n=1 Tax=Pseudorhodoferax soli TaxID=545864 RepID=A0A368XXU3_9BURK|nr:ATP-binding protein [Pseudorhodoferax soli]RCW72811.1 PAS domain S-box-containing protein [Pseudorhodoferax soli]